MPRFLVRSSSHCISSNYRHLWWVAITGSNSPIPIPLGKIVALPKSRSLTAPNNLTQNHRQVSLDSSGQWSRESNNIRTKYRRIWSHMLHMHIWNFFIFSSSPDIFSNWAGNLCILPLNGLHSLEFPPQIRHLSITTPDSRFLSHPTDLKRKKRHKNENYQELFLWSRLSLQTESFLCLQLHADGHNH